MMLKRVIGLSHWLHKYVGLFLLLFLAWMSLTGIILNHKDLVNGISVPGWMVPRHYHITNWSRGGMAGMVYVGNDDVAFAYGSQGVFMTADGGRSFTSFMGEGFPTSAWGRRTAHLVFSPTDSMIYAGTFSGLYARGVSGSSWKSIPLPVEAGPVRKLFPKLGGLLVFTDSNIIDYSVASGGRVITPAREESSHLSLIEVFFELHDGSIWGLPGRLLWDAAALVLFFLCLSSFYVWYLPKTWKWKRRDFAWKIRPSEKETFRFHLSYHKKLGWYFGVFLLVVFGTGTFMRPPLILAIMNGSVSKELYPSLESDNPWQGKIRNAAYNSREDIYLVDTGDGVFAGKLSSPVFRKYDFKAPIFAMGASVFQEISPGELLVGSFGDFYTYDLKTQEYRSLLKTKVKRAGMMSGSVMTSGMLVMPDGKMLVADQNKGLCSLDGKRYTSRFSQPEIVERNFAMPLWNYLFEIHNGRFFKGVIGGFHALIIPLGGILSLIVAVSGLVLYGISFIKKISVRT
jgi:hypothetical protein